MELSREVVKAFRLSGELVPLEGGQHTSVRIGQAVLKPVEDARHVEWLLTRMDELNPEGYRVAKPVRSKSGTFVHQGWACSHYEEGQHVSGRIEEKLQVSRLFHRDLASVPVRGFPYPDNPWAQGHRIAWQLEGLPKEMPDEIHEVIVPLLQRVSLKRTYTMQIVHGDLAGNILVDPQLSPLIIDFSPTLAPVEYAEAILVCDCIAWLGCPAAELRLLPDTQLYREMIVRAVVFRLSVAALFSKWDANSFNREVQAFKPILESIR